MKFILVGYSGYWGRKLARVITELGHTIAHQIDRNNVKDLDSVTADAVIIATPPDTHYGLTMKAMQQGMDVLVEKPMAMKGWHAAALADFAKKEGIVLSVDSTFLHSAAFKFLKDLGEPLLSYQSIRLAPPMPQAQINAGWDLIVHDLSILHRLGAINGKSHGMGIEDGAVAQAAFNLPTGGSAFIMASRVWPRKVREVVLHFPKGAYLWTLNGICTTSNWEPVVEEKEEPLKRLIMDFEDRCKNRKIEGLSDGLHGAEVCGVLERLFPNHSPFRLGQGSMGNGLYRDTPVQSVSL